ncbi:Zinc metalloprotease [Wickerhamomyces ciferrii]|uniref:Non-homologous end-joining factor 1 n=1 Tax=Wickerhamomyces ciferrii (strain ATCC 14091 / BCRC 22168 / CBS 111 / JCM 3599 / NBRC 0793 / NRRL Y-1031 F-60-10) TaxID=1206466 RepID=K0KIA4_WICCF|nr:Zinc metalloprotease [Wickerhamomyces ciferrii]CCH41897.1 Zinc metalloprotease [Wickerhamomyces ciferrii]
MNLPRKWNVLNIDSPKKYYYGVDFSTEKIHYSLYITDFSNVWISDVDEEKLHFKAIQNGIETESINGVYHTLISTFENNFNSEDVETRVDMNEMKIDKGIPLELRLNLVKVYSNAELNWNFDLVILPDSSAITILRNLIFHLSTIIFSLNEYKNDLIKVVEHKDSAIRFLGESIEGMNGGHLVSRWAPKNSSNAQSLHSFKKEKFDNLWREKKLPQIEDQYIWNVLDSNTSNSTWDYSTNFQDQPPKQTLETKERKPITDSFEENPGEDDFVQVDDDTDDESQRFDSLNIDDQKAKNSKKEEKSRDTDTESESSRESSPKKTSLNKQNDPSTPSPTKGSPSREKSSEPNTQSQSQSRESSNTPNDKAKPKPKRHFGMIGRKRKVSQTEFSPIKAQKQFQSED